MRFRNFALVMAALGVAVASPALAHPRLVAATPAANATVSPTRTVTLIFSERLTPRLSSATLVMTGLPGMANHPDMPMQGVTSAVSRDGKGLVLTSAKPIPAGSYRIDWVIVGADTHRITGTHAFSIR